MNKKISCTFAILLLGFFFFVISEFRILVDGSLDEIDVQGDPTIFRFSDHCGMQVESMENSFTPNEDNQSQRLHSLIFLVSHGDSSAPSEWPQEVSRKAQWDCTPQVLPRYWRLNQHVNFTIVDPEGNAQDRTITPDLQPWNSDTQADYACASGQLTGIGFRQMVGLGRHLATSYDDDLARIIGNNSSRLQVRSLDTQRSLASTIGVLMPLLATQPLLQVFGRGCQVEVMVQPNTTCEPLAIAEQLRAGKWGKEALAAFKETALGDHLLSRWCHQLPWPCQARLFGSSCFSLRKAATVVANGELSMCHMIAKNANSSFRLQHEVLSVVDHEDGRILFRSADGPALTSVLSALIGFQVCKDPLMARPPFASRLVLERWQSKDRQFLWRVIWNGQDITARIPGCNGFRSGCPEKGLILHLA